MANGDGSGLSDSRIHVEVLPGGIAAVLGDLYPDFDHDPERLGFLRLYVADNWLLSGRTHPLKAVDLLRRELVRAREPMTPVAAFQLLIERLADALSKVTSELGNEVDKRRRSHFGGQICRPR